MATNCRLCGQVIVDKSSSECLSLFDENGIGLPTCKVVLQHFSIKIQFDQENNYVCNKCWRITGDFHDLYEIVQAADEKLTALHPAVKDDCSESDWPDQAVSHCGDNVITDHVVKNEPIEDIIVEPNVSEIQKIDPKEEIIEEPTVQKRQRGRPAKTSTTKKKIIKPPKPPKKSRIDESELELQDQQIRDFFKMRCEICNLCFHTMREAQQHYRNSHNQVGYLVCCEKKFFRRWKALDHMRLHINPNALQCDQCNKCYSTRFALSNHQLTHDPPPLKPHNCNLCTQSFAKKYQLSQHLRVGHLDQSKKPFGCDICGKFFVTKYLLTAHIRSVHENLYSIMCHICAKTFKSKKVHDLHQLVHLDQEPPKLQCSICGSWHRHEDSLRRHIVRHKEAETETEMLCTICNKSYPTKAALSGHIRYVHSERSNKCTLCDKAFKKAVELKEHMALHTGVDLYRCSYCTRTFKSRANMYAHRKKEHFALWSQNRQQQLATNITEPNQPMLIN